MFLAALTFILRPMNNAQRVSDCSKWIGRRMGRRVNAHCDTHDDFAAFLSRSGRLGGGARVAAEETC